MEKQSRCPAHLPLPACGERVGVRGHRRIFQPHGSALRQRPLTRIASLRSHSDLSPRAGRGEKAIPSSRCAFLLAPRALRQATARKAPTKGRSAERRTLETAPRIRALPPCGFAARAPFVRRARLSALYRGSCQSLPASAQSGPALHGSGQPIRSPGSQLLADRRRGRPGGFPNRPNAVCETAPGHRSRSTFRIASGMCPWTSEMDSFSSPRGANSRNSSERSQPFDVMQIFPRSLFDDGAREL